MSSDCPFDLSNQTVVFAGKWIEARSVNFHSKSSKHSGVWESAHRITKPKNADVDGVDVIATLHKAGKKYFVLIKQYRVPIRAWCLEFPAGLIDSGETAEQAAVREMKEETGYTVTKIVSSTSGIQNLNPGLSDDSIQFIRVEIDGDDPRNVNPQPSPEGGEEIEVVLIECDKVLEFVRQHEKQLHVEAIVYAFALGYSMTQGQ